MEIGTRVWFPVQWGCGELDSILHNASGDTIAYIIKLDDGKKVAIDMQVVETFDE